MIASSYFNRAECKNKLLEKSMLLQYKEQKLESQYGIEDLCISYMDDLQKKLPPQIFKQNMKVHLRKEANGTTGVILVSKNIFFSSMEYMQEKNPISTVDFG